jgi:hypothetical protein
MDMCTFVSYTAYTYIRPLQCIFSVASASGTLGPLVQSFSCLLVCGVLFTVVHKDLYWLNARTHSYQWCHACLQYGCTDGWCTTNGGLLLACMNCCETRR